jgi:signal transduction histidine kinase
LIGLGFAQIVAGRITEPIVQLTKAMQAEAIGTASGQLALHPDNELADLAATFEHLARSMRDEMALATEQRDTLAAVLTTMTDGVAVLSAKGNVRLANPALRELLDYAGPSPIDHPFFEVASNHQIAGLADEALHGQSGELTVELAHSKRVLRLIATPLRPPGGGALLVAHDLTELQRQEQVRQEFIANASHELLTPIGTVRALADVLGHGGMDNRKSARRFLRSLQIEADRLTALARDLIDLAQADAGELRITVTPVEVHPLLATVVARLETKAAKSSVTLDLLGDDAAYVLADAPRLEQVLVNLVDNAIKFSFPGGSVTVSSQVTETSVILRVSDAGTGISAEDQKKIFDRFFKVRGSRSGPAGTGLGLAIASRYVFAMHGTIHVQSELGQGATFAVTLPRAGAPPQANLVTIRS